jgi:Lrp/AsnC family leucine-responsive transcriptional regulator
MSPIDTLDEQILAALQANGRLTMKALAEQVGLSSPAMIERVRRLEERGVIDGYRAVIAPAALGRPLTAVITAELDRGDHAAFLEAVQRDPAVAECHRTTGPATFLVKAHVADTAALERLVDELSATGARCAAALVLSSPVPYRPVMPPEGVATQRTRLSRRRRRAATGAEAPPAAEAAPKRPGRPRGRRRTTPPGGA